jgi:hypothetical protein
MIREGKRQEKRTSKMGTMQHRRSHSKEEIYNEDE